MKIKKSELISALEVTQKFVGKGNVVLSVIKTVMIDGPGKRIVATDLGHRCIVDVNITDAMQSVVKSRPPVVMPGDAFKDELGELGVDQLKDLVEYAGLPTKAKKADSLAKAIFDASVASAETEAEAEKAKPDELEAVPEIICVDPGHLLKIAKSLKEVKDEDEVEIEVEDFLEDSMFGTFFPGTVSVGKHFQRLNCKNPSDFPDDWPFKNGKAYLSTDGNTLMPSTATKPDTSEDLRDHIVKVYFDPANSGIASTDGARLHFSSVKLSKKCDPIAPPKGTVRAIASIAKEKDVKISVNGDNTVVLFETGDKIKVYVQNDSIKFPDYWQLFENEPTHTLTVNAKDLQNMLKQAKLMTDGDYKGADFTFNGNINAKVENPNLGEYEKLNVPIKEGEVKPEMTARYDVGRVLTSCGHLTGDLSIGVTDAAHPISIQTPDKKFRALIMPIQQ